MVKTEIEDSGILMVCLGNICRSPMAEGILRHKLRELNLHARVDSAGTGAWHVGEPPDPRAIKTMRNHGIDISDLRARQFDPTRDFQLFHHIYVMDSDNLLEVTRFANEHSHRDKVTMILNILTPGGNKSVPDPYYDDDNGFEHVFDLLNRATDRILQIHFSNFK